MLTTVLFDMGGTLENIWQNEETQLYGAQLIRDILERNGIVFDCTTKELADSMTKDRTAYRTWRTGTKIELKPEELWTTYMLSGFDVPKEKIIPIAEELACTWEGNNFHRELREDAKELLEALKQRGYKIGVVSNNTSRYQVFNCLEDYGIRDYMLDVTVSGVVGFAKPHPEIFRIATRQIQSKPEECVYVGDYVQADVVGSKNAGFGKTVLIQSKMEEAKTYKEDAMEPDIRITELMEIIPWLDKING